MDFIGKICPYCKTPFSEDDDVVVCSVCEMPHHKECWIENKACTTFGCTGTILGADQSVEASEKVFCTRCGTAVAGDKKFCPTCGTPIATVGGGPRFAVAGAAPVNHNTFVPPQNAYVPPQNAYVPPQNAYVPPQNAYVPPQNTYAPPQYNSYASAPVDPDIGLFVSVNKDVYLSFFQSMHANNTSVSWNWCSFLFGWYWFAYRKMHMIAAAYMGIYFICSFLGLFGSLIQLGVSVCSGLFGNHLYKKYIDGEMPIAKSMDSYNKSIFIARKGGTDTPALCIVIGITLVFNIIRVMILGL